MKNIYRREQQAGPGVFTSDKAILTMGGGGMAWAGALVQNVSWSYPQSLQDIYELGSNKTYRAIGRSVGQMQIGRLIGLSGGELFNDAFYDACGTGGVMNLTADAAAGCGNGSGSKTYNFAGVFVINFAGSANAGDLLIKEDLTLSFVSFDVG